MTWLRDEVLVAYADNQLNGETRRAVEHVLAVDEDARHNVALFQLTGFLVRRAFDGIDFTGVPVWFDALLQRQRKEAPAARTGSGRNGTRWPRLILALAACMLLGIGIGGVILAVTPAGGEPERLLVLGELPTASVLAAAFDHVSEGGASWTGPDPWRATGVASFRDRFGNDCREVEFYATPVGGVPAQIVIACRGSADKWAIVGAVTNQVSGAAVSGSAIEAYYVPTEDKARSALDGILSMLGAHERTSTTDRSTTAP